jgi:hypothetical protein
VASTAWEPTPWRGVSRRYVDPFGRVQQGIGHGANRRWIRNIRSPFGVRAARSFCSGAVGAIVGVGLGLALLREPVEALIVLDESWTLLHATQIAALAIKQRLPTMHSFREAVVAGGLMSYGPSVAEMLSISATYVVKILKGAKPGDRPVEQPTKFELVINLKTAKALGLTIPPSLLARADQVIE